jgi:prepilin-type N-terminal cleavage/methylation domain-containing protein
MYRWKRHAFTLVELLVVIAIMAVLLTLITPALQKAREQARIVLCSNNQHQVVAGVVTYSSDYEGELPPAATKTARATLLSRFKNAGDTAVGYYLFEYLPDVEIFNCPITAFDKNFSYSSAYGNDLPYSYQEIYENPDLLRNSSSTVNKRQNCSYALLWNYESFNKDSVRTWNSDPPITGNMYNAPFIGPGRKSKNQLAICDAFYFSGALGGGNYWTSNHPFANADKYQDWEFSYFLLRGMATEYLSNDDLNTIPLNAGYIDGHVDRYYSQNTIQQVAVYGWAELFLPMDWK